MLILKPNSQHQPIYFQLYQQIKQEIQTGILSAHTKMPSKRQLASQLNISVNTVTAAYHQLVDEGFLTAIPQKGFFVCPLDELIQAAIIPRQPQQVPQAESILVDFSTNNVAKDCFPFKTWRKMLILWRMIPISISWTVTMTITSPKYKKAPGKKQIFPSAG